MEIVAYIHTLFPEKFGIPRQSNLVPDAVGEIVFEPKFRTADAVKGIEEFSHLWLLWEFSKSKSEKFSATVAPPRLGGRQKKGVFATRSPFRPNSIGLSSVKLESVRMDERLGPVLVVSGVDLLDQTPIYDIKPYLPYTDSHPDACGGFADAHQSDGIDVVFPEELLCALPGELRETVCDLLRQDPRAAYNKKPDYMYGMAYGGYDIRFVVQDERLIVREVAGRGEGTARKVKGGTHMKKVEDYIRSIPDFPEPGIIFRDVTSILQSAEGLKLAIDELAKKLDGVEFDVIAGAESRGFIFGMPISYLLNKPFVPIRKAGKLPCETVAKTYDLEYGTATIEIHKDAITPGMKVVLLDDLIATGGTMRAAAELVEELGGEVVECLFLMELVDLKGREALEGYKVESVVTFEGA